METKSYEALLLEAKVKAANYCAYQERTQQQVRDKLYSLGLYQSDVEEILTSLIIDNFVNEERFARTFSAGKFRIKKWGKLKIKFHLERLNLSDYCIKKGLEEIDDAEYLETLNALIARKLGSISDENIYLLNKKIAGNLIHKGFEPELVWTTLKDRM
ncbi:regulatory protein RecX [Fulvivirgaceae bacterium BMA12]|uniref:Regulatory protein RecX n=1 Tax=Agaribacillus aureus TaxID=3051825 RepID=A0ABT8LCX8_9BACT|nr:regulatory protein RecX [Fulvivirgaceae bacterium BMA12]